MAKPQYSKEILSIMQQLREEKKEEIEEFCKSLLIIEKEPLEGEIEEKIKEKCN